METDFVVRENKHTRLQARLKLFDETDLKLLLPKLNVPLFLILDQIQDPHNLGACLRTAEGAGVDGVIFPRDHSSPITPAVRSVACGSAERVRLFQVTNLARVLTMLKEAGIWLVGTSEHATEGLYSVDFSLPSALVLGSEGSGLRRLTAEHCDRVVKIPLAGRAESLNVSVSCGVCLYEAVRQRSGRRNILSSPAV